MHEALPNSTSREAALSPKLVQALAGTRSTRGNPSALQTRASVPIVSDHVSRLGVPDEGVRGVRKDAGRPAISKDFGAPAIAGFQNRFTRLNPFTVKRDMMSFSVKPVPSVTRVSRER